MILPIPSGTRDVLPDEMGELRTLTERLRAVFSGAGYGEVYTPALEYEGVITRGALGGARPAYRVFDENGEVLVLRSDMTVPIARLVGSRYQASEPPLRFAYFAHCYRGVRPQRGQPREFLQAGVGIGDSALYPALMDALDVAPDQRPRLLAELGHGDFVGLESALAELSIDERSLELLLRVPQLRGGPDVLHGPAGPVADAVAGLRAIHGLLDADVAERVIFDLGLSRAPGYYTGAVFEVYDPAVGMPIGGGGRYDHLLGQFGRDLPAVGFALEVEKLHQALAAEERLAEGAR